MARATERDSVGIGVGVAVPVVVRLEPVEVDHEHGPPASPAHHTQPGAVHGLASTRRLPRPVSSSTRARSLSRACAFEFRRDQFLPPGLLALAIGHVQMDAGGPQRRPLGSRSITVPVSRTHVVLRRGGGTGYSQR